MAVTIDRGAKQRIGGAGTATATRGRRWCLRFGMTASSWDGWAKHQSNPYVAIDYFFESSALVTVVSIYTCTGVRGYGHMYYVVMVPVLDSVFLGAGLRCAFWRWGPGVVKYKPYQAAVLPAGPCVLPVTYIGCLGPAATVPWHVRFHFLCAHAAMTFLMHQTDAARSVAGEQPAEPRTSIMKPFSRAAIYAMMFLDVLSDLALSRSLLTVVLPH